MDGGDSTLGERERMDGLTLESADSALYCSRGSRRGLGNAPVYSEREDK